MKGRGIALGGGGGLNYEVVGGTAQPLLPKENTIWVNTGTEITDVIFSYEAPTARSDKTALSGGEVWIKLALASIVSFNALKRDGTLNVYPSNCYQFERGTWNLKAPKSFLSGVWKNWEVVYYNEGREYSELTGGFASMLGSHTNTNKMAITKETEYLRFYDQYSSQYTSSRGAVYTQKKVDLTNVNELSITYYGANTHSTKVGYLGVVDAIPSAGNLPSESSGFTFGPNVELRRSATAATQDTVTLDTSLITGMKYLLVTCAGAGGGSSRTLELRIYNITGKS